MKRKILVLGAGVSGLTTASVLIDHDFAVEIWYAEPPLHTMSRAAAAFWYPYLAKPEDKIVRWGHQSYERFGELAEDKAAGVDWLPLRVYFQKRMPDPPWVTYAKSYSRLVGSELIPHHVDGFQFLTPVVDMPIYLRYLQKQVSDKGGRFIQRTVADLKECYSTADIVVNATALGSRELVNDQGMYAVRGQVLRVLCNPVNRVTFCPEDIEGPIYIVPRRTDCILGGSSERTESLTPDFETSARIIKQCREVESQLVNVYQLGCIVGLRPCRDTVRVEREQIDENTVVVHNYGHGGSGVTLSWGCAQEVVQLIESR